ncbi:MAG: C40 family peptidase [Nocardioides sp.]
MPNFIRTTLAATASLGLLALIPAGAHASVADPISSLSSTSTTAPSTTAPTSTSTPTKTAHERKVLKKKRRAHRRAIRLHKRVVARNHVVERALATASRQQGDPYSYGSTGPNAFDCSGLMLFSFHAAGINLPRTAAAQAGAVRHIPRSQMRPGDLVFFSDGGHVYHVGMFDGWSHGRRIILHAPYSGQDVKKEAIWTNSWFAGTERIKH